MDIDALFRTALFVMTIRPGVYNTTGEKADERLYNVRRMLLSVMSLP